VTIPNWTRTEDWDALYLGGKRIPGIASVDMSLGSGLDVKKPKGGAKATIRDEGTPPTELSVTVRMTHEELERFESVIPMLRPRAVNGSRPPLEIAHPQARLWGVNVVTCGPIEAPHPETGDLYVTTFKLTEWVPAPKKMKASAPKKPEDDGGWDVDPLVAANRPSRTGDAEANF